MRERAKPCRGGRDEKGERSTGVVQASGVGGGGSASLGIDSAAPGRSARVAL